MSVHDFEDLDEPLNSFTIPQLRAVLEYHKVDPGKLRKKADIVNLCKESKITEVPEHIATPRKSRAGNRRSSTTFAFTAHNSEEELPLNVRRSTVAGDRLLAALEGENSPEQQTNSPTQPKQKIEVVAIEEPVSSESASNDDFEVVGQAEEAAAPADDEAEPVDKDLQVAASVFVDDEDYSQADKTDQNNAVEENIPTEQSSAAEESTPVEQSSAAEESTPIEQSSEAQATKDDSLAGNELFLTSSSPLPSAEDATEEVSVAAELEETTDSPSDIVVKSSDSSLFARMHQLSTGTFGAICAVGVLGYAGLSYYLLCNPPAWADAGYPLLGLFIIMACMIALGRYDEWFLKTYGPEPLIVREPEEPKSDDADAADVPTVQPPADDFDSLRAATLQLLTEQRTLLFQGIENLESQIRELTPQGQAPVRSSSASKQLRTASRDLAGMIHTLANVQAFFSAVASAEEDPEFLAILRAFAKTA